MSKKKNIVFIGVMVLIVGLGLIAAATYSFFTRQDSVRNSLTMGNPDIDLVEPKWNPNEARTVIPGKTMVKDPTLIGREGNNYARLVVEFYDLDTGEKITKVNRIEKIKELMYYDKSYNVDNTPVTSYIDPGSSYSSSELKTLVDNKQVITLYNTDDFKLDDSRSTDTKLVFNYKNILGENDKKVLFTNLVIPTNYKQSDLDLLGNFNIKIYAEAIQSDNTGSMSEAFKLLDGEGNE